MAIKVVKITELGTVRLQKRKGTRTIRLTIDQQGMIRIGMPAWMPFQAGIDFARSHAGWVETERTKQPKISIFNHGDRIGKNHTLFVEHMGQQLKTRVTDTAIIISLPDVEINNSDVQAKILSACERALKKEASHLLPQRLSTLSNQTGLPFKSVGIKKLKSRWGSCSNQKDITLNYFLMQLPWDLIDYVLLHELNHTEHMHHQSDFWEALEKLLPDYKAKRKALKAFQPTVIRTSL